MANYCSNSIVFYSKSKELLTDLWNKMDSCIEDGDNNIKKLLKGCGCTQEEVDEWADGRDYLVYLDDKVHDDDGLYYFRADTESAWAPNIDSFTFLLEEKYNDKIKLFYQSEEPGCGVFVTNDAEGIFFSERYKMDCSLDGHFITGYYASFEDLLEDINEIFPKAGVTDKDSIEAMEAKIKTAYKIADNIDDYIVIDEFLYDNEIRGGLAA